MIRPYLGSSGPDSFSIYRAGGGGALTVLILSPPPLLSPQNLVWRFGVSTGISSWFLVPLILLVSEDPDPSGTPSIRAGNSKVILSKSPRPDLLM